MRTYLFTTYWRINSTSVTSKATPPYLSKISYITLVLSGDFVAQYLISMCLQTVVQMSFFCFWQITYEFEYVCGILFFFATLSFYHLIIRRVYVFIKHVHFKLRHDTTFTFLYPNTHIIEKFISIPSQMKSLKRSTVRKIIETIKKLYKSYKVKYRNCQNEWKVIRGAESAKEIVETRKMSFTVKQRSRRKNRKVI